MTAQEFNDLINKEYNPATKKVSLYGQSCSQSLSIEWENEVHMRFDNCIFDQEVTVFNCVEKSEIVFNDCLFKGPLIISYSKSHVTYKILFCKLEDGLQLQESESISLFLGETEGKGEFLLDNSKFEHCSFEGFRFTQNEINDKISFFNCLFNVANFKETILSNATFNNSSFKADVTFDRATINYNHVPYIGNFFSVTFEKGAFFNGTDFTKGAFFNGSTFKGNAIFVGCNADHFDCLGNFSGCLFEKRVFFDVSKFQKFTIINTEFREVASFNAINCQEIELGRCIFLQYADFLDAKIDNAPRETFRTIKNEFLRHNNSVEALIYQAKELRIYESSITLKNQPKEKIVLWFNKVSNDFGTNWARAIRFTLIVSVLFYLFYILTLSQFPFHLGWDGWRDFHLCIDLNLKYFFKFFIITHDLDFMSSYKPRGISYFIDTLGRILIGYGIYQTVQAFRKYGK